MALANGAKICLRAFCKTRHMSQNTRANLVHKRAQIEMRFGNVVLDEQRHSKRKKELFNAAKKLHSRQLNIEIAADS